MPGFHGNGCNCQHEANLINGEDLLSYIDKDSVHALNETILGSCKTLFRPYSDRLLETFLCKSQENDPELLVFIPFKSPCSIYSLYIIGGENGTSPNHIRLYINDESLDFLTIENMEPIQSFDLVEDFCGIVEYPLKVSKFRNVNLLILHFPSSFSSNQTNIYYIRICGQGTSYQRKAVEAVYESTPNISDHMTNHETLQSFDL
ncbi:hypothetical protein cand_017510 [Cryptosporidium andersoni]|uniref:PITH domain-containing protein n=1 Tax=Cryptosporidium andersoni TaxID=117008 RepID=A0A1J4ML53_9CRYT|nr:hypothetical protein cand_017510 [Cryptosporidium andersoni]